MESAFLRRGIAGLELAAIPTNFPQSTSNPDLDGRHGREACAAWKYVMQTKKLHAITLRAGFAGLPTASSPHGPISSIAPERNNRLKPLAPLDQARLQSGEPLREAASFLWCADERWQQGRESVICCAGIPDTLTAVLVSASNRRPAQEGLGQSQINPDGVEQLLLRPSYHRAQARAFLFRILGRRRSHVAWMLAPSVTHSTS
jgi:hypothetical protein